jgi:hypothetical protein|tara:strand:+ start:93 stop:959 length:867 start_codon:yes stop_codon:yes gene_type:complete
MSGFHLAGIVPVAGQPLDFNMPWHDSLMPISQNYLAVERAVIECAYAGCETIWLICHTDMQPLIRHRLGDYVQDPVWINRRYELQRDKFHKPVPIHYVPIHPRDREKRDCLSWSVLYGAWMSQKVCGRLSIHLKPDMYYTAFPYGVYHVSKVREHRKAISSKRPFYLSHNGKTIIDGEYLAFTATPDTFRRLSSEVAVKSTGVYEDEARTKKLPIEERYSYRHFKLEQVFDTLSLDGAKVHELERYWRIDSWEEYKKYMAVEKAHIRRPGKSLLSYKEWNGIGVDEIE